MCSQRNGGVRTEGRIGLEIHVGDYGWRLIAGSVGQGAGRWSSGCLSDTKLMRRRNKGVVGQGKMTEVD